jgi:hypothetical protein
MQEQKSTFRMICDHKLSSDPESAFLSLLSLAFSLAGFFYYFFCFLPIASESNGITRR